MVLPNLEGFDSADRWTHVLGQSGQDNGNPNGRLSASVA